MTVTLIAAVADNGVIGVDGDLPWRLSEDLKRFKELTLGHTLVMGRKTYESLGGPLPGRTTVVVTRQQGWSAPGVEVAHSVERALALVSGHAWVTGGGQVYGAAFPYADRLELTEVHQSPDGDASFPDWDRSLWTEVAREERDGYAFVSYERAPLLASDAQEVGTWWMIRRKQRVGWGGGGGASAAAGP